MKQVILLAAILLAPSLLAWDDTGHQVVAGIAWENMTPPARTSAVALLLSAPENACLRDLFSQDPSRPPEERQREFFMRAATWSDIVRDRCTSFGRAPWHFINFFWEGRSGPSARDVDREPPQPNVVGQLETLHGQLACAPANCGTDAERAIALAWILHLTGDIHQPLHTAARVTQSLPDGDRGGGRFDLDEFNGSLHSYWDNIIDKAQPRRQGESRIEHADRMIELITDEHPRSGFTSRLHPAEFETWAREGFATIKRVVYPSSLRVGQRPSNTYRRTAFRAAKPALALAGYRLADLLNGALDPP